MFIQRQSDKMSGFDYAYDFLPPIYRDVKCPKCLLHFRAGDRLHYAVGQAPLLLACGHAVCERCFGKLSSWICSVCEKETVVDKGDKRSKHLYILGLLVDSHCRSIVYNNPFQMKKLPMDIILTSAMKKPFIKGNCQECIRAKATVQCRKCAIEVCFPCFKQIHAPQTIKHHKPEPVTIPCAALSCLLPECVDHPQNVATLLCVTCSKDSSKEKFFCTACTLFGGHQDHNVVDMATLTNEHLPELKKAMEVLKDTVDQLQDRIKACNYRGKRALHSRDLATSQIRSFTQRLHGLLQMQEEAAMAKLHHLNNKLQDTLYNQQTELEKEVHTRETVLKYAELLVNSEVPSVHPSNFLLELKRLCNCTEFPMPKAAEYCTEDVFRCVVKEDVKDLLHDCVTVVDMDDTFDSKSDSQLPITDIDGSPKHCAVTSALYHTSDLDACVNDDPTTPRGGARKKAPTKRSSTVSSLIRAKDNYYANLGGSSIDNDVNSDKNEPDLPLINLAVEDEAVDSFSVKRNIPEVNVYLEKQGGYSLDIFSPKTKVFHLLNDGNMLNNSFSDLHLSGGSPTQELNDDDLINLTSESEEFLLKDFTESTHDQSNVNQRLIDVQDSNEERNSEKHVEALSESESESSSASSVSEPYHIFKIDKARLDYKRKSMYVHSSKALTVPPAATSDGDGDVTSCGANLELAVALEGACTEKEKTALVPQVNGNICKEDSNLKCVQNQCLSSSKRWEVYGARPRFTSSDLLPDNQNSPENIRVSSPITKADSTSSLNSCTSSVISALMPAKATTLLMEERVRVTFVDTPSMFYVQRDVDYEKITKLCHELNRIAREHSQIREIIPFVGKLYLGRFTYDGNWYRVLVLSVQPEKSVIYVQYVDYGNKENLKTSRLRDCPPRFQLEQLPPFNLACGLWEILPARGDVWDSEAVSTFTDLVKETTLQLYVMDYETVDDIKKCLVELRRPWSTIGIANDLPLSIREVLIFLEFGLYVNHSSQDLYNKKAGVSVTCKYNKPEIPFGADSTHVVLSAVTSPHNFHLQLASSDSYLERLMNDLDVHYKQPKISATLDWHIYAPKIGMLCVAKYTGDGRWHRALIEDLPGDRKVDVKYVDYGNKERLRYKQILKISDKFLGLPAQAIPCRLLGIEPPEDSWTEGIADLMTNIWDTQDVVATFHSYEEETCTVSLAFSVGDTTIDFGDQLIHMDVAQGPTKRKYSKQTRNICNRLKLNKEEQIRKKELTSVLALPKRDKEVVMFNTTGCQNIKEVEYLGITSPSCIHLRLASNLSPFKELQSQLEKGMQEESSIIDFNPSFGEMCVVKRKKTFARARIIGIKEGFAEVHLVDCGGIEKVQLSELLPLPKGLGLVKDISIAVSLAGIVPPGGQGQWPGITRDRLEELLSNRSGWYIKPKADADCHQEYEVKVLPVELGFTEVKMGGPFEANSSIYVSINDLLIQEGLALPDHSGSPFSVAGATSMVELEEVELDIEPIHPLSKRKFASVDSELSTEELESSSSFESYSNNFHDWLPCPPPKSMTFTANPTYVDGEGIIYLQPHWNARTLDMICEGQCMQFAKSSPSDNDLCWSPGDPVIAKYFLDKKWYRATVLKLLDKGQVSVRFVDFGNVETANLADLRRSIIYDQIPIQCYKAVLHCIQPKTLDGSWETKVLDFIHKTVVEKECFITVKEKPVPDKPLEIELVVAEHEIDIMSMLVDKLKVCRRAAPKKPLDEEESRDVVIESESLEVPQFPIVRLPSLCLPLKSTEKILVKITAIKDPAHVYISPVFTDEPVVSEYQEMLKSEAIVYRDFFSSVNSDPSKYQTVEDPQIDGIYLGRFSSQMYRVQVMDTGPDKVTALFVDTGNLEDILIEDLRECPKNGKDIPLQAVGVELYRVEPPQGSNTPWSEEAMTAMIECLMNSDNQCFLAKVMDSGSPTQIELYQRDSEEKAYADVISRGLIALRKKIEE